MSRLAILVVLATSCGRIGFDASPELCAGGGDCDGLRIASTSINAESEFATGPRLSVAVTVKGGVPPLEVRVALAAEGDCQSQYQDSNWVAHTTAAAPIDFIVEPSDGEKKLCAWAKDAAGNLTLISPSTGTEGVNADSIQFAAQNIPVVSSFRVRNASTGAFTHQVGDPLTIEWDVSDLEGLADNPIDLYVTEGGGIWQRIADGVGGTGSTPNQNRGSYAAFSAPTADPFRLRLVARDSSGNSSIAALSEVQNGGNWSVFMGSEDRRHRGAASSVQLLHGENAQGHFAVDEKTGDAYATDFKNGVVRMDGATGQVEQLLGDGPLTLPDDGILTGDETIPRIASLKMGVDGKLYLGVGLESTTVSAFVYQYDPATRTMRRYIGGGTVSDSSATPESVFALGSHFDFDEDGTLYFLTRCDGGTGQRRLMKVAQRPDGSAGAFVVVAGDCTAGTPPAGPSDPLAIPLGITSSQIMNITVWNRGSRIFYGGYSGGTWKIIDGMHYASNINIGAAEALAYDPSTSTLLAADSEIVRYQPNLLGADGDTLIETVVSNTGVGDCTRNGVPVAEACVHTQYSMQVGDQGTLYFADGAGLNEERPYRVRFVDQAERVQTYLGAASFSGDGGTARAARGTITGIHYKADSDPNQAAFPAGLYFLDSGAQVLGHVAPASEQVSVLWGNQSGTAVQHQTGDAIGPEVGLGVAYAGGNMETLAFDDEGLPWLRYGPAKNRSVLIRVDANRQVVALQGGSDDWELVADGSDPFDADLWPYGTQHNLALRGHSAFLTGSFESSSTTAVMKVLDFANGVVRSAIGAAPNGISPDLPTPGDAVSASLSQSCHFNLGDCWIQYRADEDRLYFTEVDKIRYLTSPADPTLSTLGTFWDTAPSSIENFSFSPDRTMLFYMLGGQLHCHDIGSAPAWCDDSRLGPPALMGNIRSGPNQFTWKDATTLLVSAFDGEVFAFDASP